MQRGMEVGFQATFGPEYPILAMFCSIRGVRLKIPPGAHLQGAGAKTPVQITSLEGFGVSDKVRTIRFRNCKSVCVLTAQ